ncbi:unnamed protein product [Adineta steineri]|uniref:RING-type domain-containing protein n=1 Tax=Adineta steineri TaxID=433720 RepID=A0A820EIZ9_9BILA|nr:unnamed protein product [Adineta steineri]CAF4247562.1 unnamed protein product [Adineta steineri]
MTDMNDNLTLSLTCAICLDLASAENAIETSCCHHLFCLTCIENVRPCPFCRANNFQTTPAYFARRLIGDMLVICPNDGCSTKISRSDLPNHITVHCAYRILTCPDPQCKDFKCTKNLFLEHLTKQHGQFITNNYEKLWQTQTEIEQITKNKKSNVSDNASATNNESTFDDRIGQTQNKFGRKARLGISGKFYCGGQLDGLRCLCCNGKCGLSTGCNCSGCMLLDVKKRNLSYGWLVNRDGASARCSPQEPTKFYCGRMVMTHNIRTDGYCGPTNGEQCKACQKLSEQQHNRYAGIWTQ